MKTSKNYLKCDEIKENKPQSVKPFGEKPKCCASYSLTKRAAGTRPEARPSALIITCTNKQLIFGNGAIQAAATNVANWNNSPTENEAVCLEIHRSRKSSQKSQGKKRISYIPSSIEQSYSDICSYFTAQQPDGSSNIIPIKSAQSFP